MKKHNIILGASLIAALGFGSFTALADTNSLAVNLPQGINSCIPTQQVVSAQVVATAQKSGSTYYLMNAYQSNDPIPSDLLISVKAPRCTLHLYNPMGDVIPLSRFVPEDVARSLVLQRLKSAVKEIGGKEQFQQRLLAESSQTDLSYWSPEELWALQQLGIRPPENVKVISPESIKVSPVEQE